MRSIFAASAAAVALFAVQPAAAAAVQEPDYTEESAVFALGNAVFTLYHEVGHALISELELPVLGREEDAVDQFAAFLLTPDADNKEQDVSILADAMAGWFLSSAQTELADIAWWDEHGPDQQRAWQIACLLYGSNPDGYGEFADAIELPEERRATCPGDYESAGRGWLTLIAPHMVEDGEKSSSTVRVSYEDAGDYAFERELLEESELMETIAADLSSTFNLPRALRMTGKACGEPNAYWDSEAGEVTMCYELIREFKALHDSAQ